MISGFSDVRYRFTQARQHIEERLTLIIDFYHLLQLFAVKRLISEPISRTDVADKHARYKRCYLVRRSREGHE